MHRRLVVGLVVAIGLLGAAAPARASSVSGLTVDNSSPSQAAGARTIYKISFTATAGVPALGSITVQLPSGTDFSGFNGSSIAVAGATVGQCGGANTSTDVVTCNLSSGQTIAPRQAVVVTLNGIGNSSVAGVPHTLTVTTTGDTDAASAPVTIGAQAQVSGASVDNTSPTNAAGARTTYVVTFTTSRSGALSNAANSQITLQFPSGTTFDGLNSSSVVDTTAGATVGACGGANTSTRVVTCGLSTGSAVPAGHTVRVTLGGVANPTASGSLTLSTSSDVAAASPAVTVAASHAIGALHVDNTSPTTAAGARTVYVITFTASSTGALSNAADSIITLQFPAGTAFDGFNGSSVADTTSGATVGACGGANTATRVVTCSLSIGKTIPAGDGVRVTLNGIANPTSANPALTVSTSSDTADTAALGVAPSHPLATPAVDNTTPTSAAGARTVYVVTFTTSATGALSNAADSIVTLQFPAGTTFAGFNGSAVADTTAGATVGACGGANTATRVVTCSLSVGRTIPAGHAVRVTLNGITNPTASGTLALSTSSDTGVAPAVTVVPAQAISGLTTTPASTTPGAVTNYAIAFTTSPVGTLANAANSVITLVFPAGTGFTGYNGSSVTDATAGANVGACGGANTATRTVTCSLFGGDSIPGGHAVRVTLDNITNPSTAGPYAVATSTTSDVGTAGGSTQGGGGGAQATPTPLPAVSPTPTPSPTPTATPTPTPVAGKSVVAAPVKGTVKVRLPGTHTFVDLGSTQGIPVGATVDTRHGTVQLTALQKPGGRTETAIFYAGQFKLTQTRATTDLTLNQPLAPCHRRATASAAAKRKKPRTRRLWGSGHGSFRTRGTYSAATVRGTKWLVQDSCAGTLTRVARGVVSVRDDVRHKTITLRAGKQYLARPRH